MNIQPSLPSLPKLAANFIKATTKHVVNGMKYVDNNEYERRLSICNKNECGFRVGVRCMHKDCGCFLDRKAWWQSEHCPIKLW